MKILLAEDNPVNQELFSILLGRLGYTADIVDNGIQVIEQLKIQRYDLILMDMSMPYMDGVEATQYIRQHFPPDQQPRIVAMTANATSKDRKKCLDAGMNDFINKPISFKELNSVLTGKPVSA